MQFRHYYWVRFAIAYVVSCLLAVTGYVVANGLLFRGTLRGVAEGVTYEFHYGLGHHSISHILFLTKLTVLLGCILAIPLMIVAERKSIRRVTFFAASGLLVGLLFQLGTVWTAWSLLSSNSEMLKAQSFRLAADFLLAASFGGCGGLAYWALAGKKSGDWKTPVQVIS